MEHNNNLTPENKVDIDQVDIAENCQNEENLEVEQNKKKKTDNKRFNKEKKQKIKNAALFKKGSYSLAVTAAFLIGVIVVNILVGALANRFVLEFDMSMQKISSITEENVEFIKDVEDEISIVVCANKDNYVSGEMEYYAQQYSVLDENATGYYSQTVKLIERYADYNKKITVKFVDPQSSEFSAIASKYSNETIAYGDIFVSTVKNDVEKYKLISYADIYALSADETYANYGYTAYNVTGNNIETALTGAIAYVTSDKEKKVAFITGHSTIDYTEEYRELLKRNNYAIDDINDSLITNISDEYDAIIIVAPNKDFIGSELDVIAEFLDNNGKSDKGLFFFANTDTEYLTNLYDFLSQWGIDVQEGILFETNEDYHIPQDPTTMLSFAAEENDLTKNLNYCLTAYNVPISEKFESENGVVVTPLVTTFETVVKAPLDTPKTWDGYKDYEQKSYCTVIEAAKTSFDDEDNAINSRIYAFSSMQFIYSEYNEQTAISNKDIILSTLESVAMSGEQSIKFVSKTISNTSFAGQVTEASVRAIKIIFIYLIPLICLAVGTFIYIKRRNA